MGKGEGDRCCHWWQIAEPQGRESEGRCKFCGARKRFKNSLDEASVWSKATADLTAAVRRGQARERVLDDLAGDGERGG